MSPLEHKDEPTGSVMCTCHALLGHEAHSLWSSAGGCYVVINSIASRTVELDKARYVCVKVLGN